MKELVRSSIELELDKYIKMVLLVADGKFRNLKEIIDTGITEVLKQYPEGYFNELEKKHADIVEGIKNSRKVVTRGVLRRWAIK